MFDNVSGNFDSFDSTVSFTDSTASFKNDYYKGWKVESDDIPLSKITSNTATTIYMDGDITDNGQYTIRFVTKEDLIKMDSIVDDDIESIYLDKFDLSRRYFENKITQIYPDQNVYNLQVLQPSFLYYTLHLIHLDLASDAESFNMTKAQNFKSYSDELWNNGYPLIHIDFNLDLKISDDEKNIKPKSASLSVGIPSF